MKKWSNRLKQSDDFDEPNIISIKNPSSDNDESKGNKIYFYGDVNRDSVLDLVRNIDELTKQFKILQFTYNLKDPPPIELHIHTDGGDVFSAISAVDKITNNTVPIHTYCEGIVASAGTLISVSGKKRFTTKNSCLLLHQISSQYWGNFSEFQDEIKNLDLIMNLIKGVYLKRTKFTEKELNKILKHDRYLDSEKCLKCGLVDEIV